MPPGFLGQIGDQLAAGGALGHITELLHQCAVFLGDGIKQILYHRRVKATGAGAGVISATGAGAGVISATGAGAASATGAALATGAATGDAAAAAAKK